MHPLARAIAACAGLAAVAAGSVTLAFAADTTPSFPGLTVFGAPSAMVLPGAYDTKLPTANSQALSMRLALDSGSELDLGSRFSGNSVVTNSALMNTSLLSLANGGHYAGFTTMASTDLRLRLGASLRSDRLDNFAFTPQATAGLPLAFDRNQNQSLLAGASYAATDWMTVGVNAISSVRTGAPLDSLVAAPFNQRASTQGLDLSAQFDLGSSWVTNLDYGLGSTQLNQQASSQKDETYSFAIAKRGVFGDDAVGFSLSRPTPGLATSFASLDTWSNVPPLMLSNSKLAAPETDLQLGYVTSFLGGKVALQTNAAYQMNYQGQTGANAVSILSRAKIKL